MTGQIQIQPTKDIELVKLGVLRFLYEDKALKRGNWLISPSLYAAGSAHAFIGEG